jgi:deazaflavin-dependent oxidoreductase (nitroreductase family)
MKQTFRQTFTILIASLFGFLVGFLTCLTWITARLWHQQDQVFMRQVAAFNKRWTNRAIRPLAGVPLSLYALIEHTGRRSGQHYTTPVLITPITDGFMIPLLYGEKSDWYRNLLAAKHGTVLWQGRHYEIKKPEMVGAEEALADFPPFIRQRIQRYGIDHFIKVQARQIEPAQTRQSADTQQTATPAFGQ